MEKTYVSNFRLRCYHCPKCDNHIQFYGNDPVLGECCGVPLASLPLESDANEKKVQIVEYVVAK